MSIRRHPTAIAFFIDPPPPPKKVGVFTLPENFRNFTTEGIRTIRQLLIDQFNRTQAKIDQLWTVRWPEMYATFEAQRFNSRQIKATFAYKEFDEELTDLGKVQEKTKEQIKELEGELELRVPPR